MTSLEALLERDGRLVYKTKGISMLPMLHQDRDLVILRVPSARLQKYDVALYKRGENYVLHRVIGVESDHYRIRGDNTYSVERVPFDAIIGVLTGFQRKGKQYSVTDGGYRRYVRFWCAVYPVRALAVRCLRKAKSIAQKLGFRRPGRRA